jgi:DNA-binding MarR family transcriptional regulator
VDYRYLGVATSGTTMFRAIGGSVGVAVFGAILSAGLASGLSSRLPPGTSVPHAPDAAAIARLPPEVQSVYLTAFVDALQPVFLIAAIVTTLGFVLAWFMEEVELRGPARAEDIGDAFAMPRDATSLEELASIVSRINGGKHRWAVLERIARRLEVDLQPDEIWLLAVLGREEDAVTQSALLARYSLSPGELGTLAGQLRERGLVGSETDGVIAITAKGRAMYTDMVQGYRRRLSELVSRWHPEQHDEVRRMLADFSRRLVEDLPRRAEQV